MATETDTHTEELRFRLRGGLYGPGDPEYADTCTLFSSMIDRRPRLVARCAAPDDVVAALAYARGRGLPVAIRGGGHSVTGASLCDDGLVLDMRGMQDVEVDPEARIARVGAGATWADVDRATCEHGLATTGGRVSTTGVVGLTLGGGSGWLERKHGLACDNLVAAELVTADGRLVRASDDENPDLIWALRGGGGNFGAVTSVELQLHRLEPEILAGLVLHRAERGRELLAVFRDVMLDAPEELGLALLYLTGPDEPEIPPELRGEPLIAIAGMYAGPVEEAERVLRPVRELGPPEVDFFGTTTYPEFQCSIDDPPGFRVYWTAENLVEMPDEALDVMHERALGYPAGASQYLVVPWGGAIARGGVDRSPLAGRDTRFVVHPFMLWDDPAEDDGMIALGRASREDLRPWATGETYLNFIADEGEERVRAGFAPEARERLARVKAEWDPGNVFRGNQDIRLAV